MTAQKDSYSSVVVRSAMPANIVNDDTDGTGASIDTKGYESVLFAVSVGISGDTLSGSLKHEFLVEHADDNGSDAPGSFAAVTDAADLVGVTPTAVTGIFAIIDAAAEDPDTLEFGYVGNKRWVRFRDETTGTHTVGTPMAGVAILGHPRHVPAR